jgi:integrase
MAEQWDERAAGSNPCRHIKKYAEASRERFLSAEELTAFSEALATVERDNAEPPCALAAIRLLILTGCRLSEILSLRWEWVDEEQACLRLPDSKTGAKTIPLGAPALKLLIELPRQGGSPYVLPAARGDGHFIGISSASTCPRRRTTGTSTSKCARRTRSFMRTASHCRLWGISLVECDYIEPGTSLSLWRYWHSDPRNGCPARRVTRGKAVLRVPLDLI